MRLVRAHLARIKFFTCVINTAAFVTPVTFAITYVTVYIYCDLCVWVDFLRCYRITFVTSIFSCIRQHMSHIHTYEQAKLYFTSSLRVVFGPSKRQNILVAFQARTIRPKNLHNFSDFLTLKHDAGIFQVVKNGI